MDTDRNLLFGVLALQLDLIDAPRFAEVCSAWAGRKGTPLADLLVERGWLTAEDKTDVERLLQRKLTRHGGDARASLAATADRDVRATLAAIEDSDIAHSLARLEQHDVLSRVSTVNPLPEARGRYVLTRLHAQGGLGRVWLARDNSLCRDVALKELRPEGAEQPALWARFLEEAQVTGQLEHPGIVPVYELARRADDGQPFYAMRFVRGRTLSAAIKAYHDQRQAGTATPLELRGLLNAFVAVCNAAAYAHSRGVIHRDLKPANVVLGDFGEVMVLDWGLAKVLGRGPVGEPAPPVALAADQPHQETARGQVLGTPAYMAPEQAEGRPDVLGARTDVYGLGAILYEILTGQPPFTGEGDMLEVLRRVREEAPAPPRRLVAGAPPALEAVCLKALAKKPVDRYPAAKDVADEVQRWLADEPVHAYPEPATVRAGRWARRHRTWVAGAAAAAAVAVITLGTATVLLQQARNVAQLREREASEQRDEARAKYRLARDAVNQMLTEVGETKLKDVPAMEPVRRALLEKALAFYQQFLQERHDDPDLQRDTGQALERVGRINHLLGKHDAALAAFQQALELQGRLVDEYPGEPEYRWDVATTCMSLDKLYVDLHRLDQVGPASERAMNLLEGLVRDHPGVEKYRFDLANSYNNLAVLHQETGRRDPARGCFQKALALYEPLAREHPGKADYQMWLAGAQQNFGRLCAETGQLAEAEALYKTALATWDRLVRTYPNDPTYRNVQSKTYFNLGRLYQIQLARFDQAEAAYQEMLQIRTRLAREHPAVTEYQTELAWAYQNLAWLHQVMGQLSRAEPDFQSALAIHERLAREQPTEPEFRHAVAMIYHNLGYFYMTARQPDKAEEAYLKSLPVREQLCREQPRSVQFRQLLGQLQHELGSLYAPRQPAKAEAAYRSALAVREELYRTQPEVPKHREDLAWSYTNLSNLQADRGKKAEALETLDKALPLWEGLAREKPKAIGYAAGLGSGYASRADLLRAAGRPEEALDWYSRAIAVLEPAHRQEPRHEDSRNNLRDAHWGRATTLTQQGRHTEALKDWDRALELADDQARLALRVARAGTLARLGDHARAAAEGAEVEGGKPDSGDLLYQLACLWSLCAAAVGRDAKVPAAERDTQSGQYTARGLERLAQARAAGHFKDPTHVKDLKSTADLAALRERKGFQKLLAEVEAPPAPADKK
jgi:serine/threonine-protein kinase